MLTCWALISLHCGINNFIDYTENLSPKCMFIPDWAWAAWVLCICRTGRWKPVFLLWWRPRIYCPDNRQSYGPSAKEGTLHRCRQSQCRSPTVKQTQQGSTLHRAFTVWQCSSYLSSPSLIGDLKQHEKISILCLPSSWYIIYILELQTPQCQQSIMLPWIQWVCCGQQCMLLSLNLFKFWHIN